MVLTSAQPLEKRTIHIISSYHHKWVLDGIGHKINPTQCMQFDATFVRALPLGLSNFGYLAEEHARDFRAMLLQSQLTPKNKSLLGNIEHPLVS